MSSSSSKQRTVRFQPRWSDESWELTISPDDSAADVLAELQRKTRSRQVSDMSIYIDEENRNEAPAFRRLDGDEKVLRAILMCVANASPNLYIASRAATSITFHAAPGLDRLSAESAVACFEHTSAEEAIRRLLLAQSNADASSVARDSLLVVKELYADAAKAAAGKAPTQRAPLAKAALILHEKRVAELDSWVVRFVVESAPPSAKAPAAPAPAPPVKSPSKASKTSSSHKEKATTEKSEKSEKTSKGEKKKKSSSKSKDKEKEKDKSADDAEEEETSSASSRRSSSSAKLTSAPSRRTLQRHADAVKSGNASVSDLVEAASKSIGATTTSAATAAAAAAAAAAGSKSESASSGKKALPPVPAHDAQHQKQLDEVRERLREQEAELERLRDAPSADEWRKLLDKRVQAVEADYGARLGAAQTETDAAAAALQASQKREREAQRQLEQLAETLAAAQAGVERERQVAQRERDDAVAQAQAQSGVAQRERDLKASQLEIERDALQSQVVSLQQRVAKQAVDVSQAQAEVAVKESVAVELRKQHNAASNEARALRLDLTTAREQVAQLREQVAQAGDVAALKASLAEERAVVAKLQEQTQGGDQIAALQTQLAEQRASSQRLLVEHREQQRRDQDELAHLRALAAEVPSGGGGGGGGASSEALKRELEQLREELAESETQCEKYAELLQKARKQYDAEYERLAELDALAVRLEAAESEKRRVEQLLRDADAASTASATRHLARVDELRAELNQREAALEAANDELEQLRQTCAAASDLARDRKQEADARRDEAYALNEKLSGASQTNDELTRRFLQTQNLCAEQENQLNDMRSRLAAVVATRRDVVADANGKAPKSGAKALEFYKSSFENEVLTRTSLELLLAEKASSVFAAEAGAANAQQQVAMLEASMAELRKQLSKAQGEQARLADGFVANTSTAAESLEQLKRERDQYRQKWLRAVHESANANGRDGESDDSGSMSGSYSETETDDGDDEE